MSSLYAVAFHRLFFYVMRQNQDVDYDFFVVADAIDSVDSDDAVDAVSAISAAVCIFPSVVVVVDFYYDTIYVHIYANRPELFAHKC